MLIDQIKENYAISITDRKIAIIIIKEKRKLTLLRSSLRERSESRVPTRRLGMLNCDEERQRKKKIDELITELD